MINIDDIILTPLEGDLLDKITNNLNNDPEVNKFITFNNKKQSNGILLNNKVIGLFELYKFINGSITIHSALLKEYRNKGIGKIIINKIVEEYGKNYPDSEYFIVNIDYKNERAIRSIEKTDWEKTYDYDEIMIDEGSQFFVLYQKRNPNFYRKKKELLQ